MISKPRSPTSIQGLTIKHDHVGNHIIVKPQWFDGKNWDDFVFFGKTVEVRMAMPKLHGNFLPIGNKTERAEVQVRNWLKRWVIKSLPGRNMAIQEDRPDTKPKTKKKAIKLNEEEAPRDVAQADIPGEDDRPETPASIWSSAQGID